MKIIKKDNLDRQSVSDVLVAGNVNEFWGQTIVRALNETLGGENSQDWFVLKPDDYQLYTYDPT